MKNIHYKVILFTYCIVLLHIDVIAQIEGLWVVNKVQVGDQEMTPVAKWVKLEADGTQFSGNGWLQHTTGDWKLNTYTSELSFISNPGPADEFGAFKIQYDDQKMTWEREEEGQKVVVTLKRAAELPQSPADQIQGLWDLEKVIQKEQDITNNYDPNNKAYLFIRWDRLYIERTAEATRNTGFWYIDLHHPELQLISHNKSKEYKKWRISFDDSKMTWVGLDEDNKDLILIYSRINTFPK